MLPGKPCALLVVKVIKGEVPFALEMIIAPQLIRGRLLHHGGSDLRGRKLLGRGF